MEFPSQPDNWKSPSINYPDSVLQFSSLFWTPLPLPHPTSNPVFSVFNALLILPRVHTSNGNDIETKRNDASVIGVFSVAKRNEPTYSRTWKDSNEANTIINIHCRIEEIIPEFSGSKIKRI
jgi:hypothetical protein